MTAIRAFFPKFGYFFLISRKGKGRTAAFMFFYVHYVDSVYWKLQTIYLRKTFLRNFCVTACSFSKTILFWKILKLLFSESQWLLISSFFWRFFMFKNSKVNVQNSSLIVGTTSWDCNLFHMVNNRYLYLSVPS